MFCKNVWNIWTVCISLCYNVFQSVSNFSARCLLHRYGNTIKIVLCFSFSIFLHLYWQLTGLTTRCRKKLAFLKIFSILYFTKFDVTKVYFLIFFETAQNVNVLDFGSVGLSSIISRILNWISGFNLNTCDKAPNVSLIKLQLIYIWSEEWFCTDISGPNLTAKISQINYFFRNDCSFKDTLHDNFL